MPIAFEKFRKIAQNHLSAYFNTAAGLLDSGKSVPPSGKICLFPTVVVFTRTPTHYAFELFGARRRRGSLDAKIHKSHSFDLFLGDFEYKGPTEYIFIFTPSPDMSVEPRLITDVALTAEKTLTELDERYPGVRGLFGGQIRRSVPTPVECIKSFEGSGLDGPMLINRCLITNSLGPIVRARYTNLLFAVPATIEAEQLSGALSELIRVRQDLMPGVQAAAEGYEESIAQAGQLANLYLRGVHETALTQFLESHEDIIRYALNADKILFQPSFPWKTGNPDPSEKAIQPDIIVRRADGVWFIIDFKLPLLGRSSITTGGHRRRRFVHTVADGVAQLHNYHDYFSYQENRDAAAVLLGEQVTDPQLMLVVGTSENVDLTEVDEAKRALKPIEIVDYDTLIRVFLATRTS